MDLSAGTQGELPIPMHAPALPFTGGEGTDGVGGHVPHQLQHHEAEHGNNNSNGNEQSSPAQLVPPAAAAGGISGKKRVGGAGSAAAVKYGECLKNHAAAIGGNATDGCGEFTPSGQEGSLEALKCSACGCHRNFHRKEVDDDDDVLGHGGNRAGRRFVAPALPHHNNLLVTTAADPYAAYAAMRSVAPLHQHQFMNAVPLSAAAMQQHASESDEMDGGRGSKKRFRTKFTAEQKERMLEFAERVEWRLQKVDDAMVQAFCQEIGVKRRVLKVWMHNNKYNLAIKRLQAPPMPAASASPPSSPQMPMPMEPPPPSQPETSFHLGGPSSTPPQQMVMPMVPPPSQPEPSFHLGGPGSPPPQQMVMPMVPPPPFHRGPDSPEPLKLD
jgi:ZF-HD class homeobox domain-containing protein